MNIIHVSVLVILIVTTLMNFCFCLKLKHRQNSQIFNTFPNKTLKNFKQTYNSNENNNSKLNYIKKDRLFKSNNYDETTSLETTSTNYQTTTRLITTTFVSETCKEYVDYYENYISEKKCLMYCCGYCRNRFCCSLIELRLEQSICPVVYPTTSYKITTTTLKNSSQGSFIYILLVISIIFVSLIVIGLSCYKRHVGRSMIQPNRANINYNVPIQANYPRNQPFATYPTQIVNNQTANANEDNTNQTNTAQLNDQPPPYKSLNFPIETTV